MPDSLPAAIPYLLAAVVALLPRGASLRCGGVGTALVALATAAAARVTAGSPSFNAINGALLYGGLLLVAGGIVAAWRSGWRDREPPSIAAETPAPAVNGVRAFMRRWGMPVLLGLLLIPSAWFFFTVAGPDARSLPAILDAPFSAAGETLLAALLLPATLVLAGSWPFGPLARGPRLAPLGALLLLGIIVPRLGEGLEHWRSPYAAWLVLAAFVSAAGANWPALLASVGLFAIACSGGQVRMAGVVLSIIASVWSLSPDAPPVLRRIVLLGVAACAIAALRATLGVEVVYSVLMVLAFMLGVLRTPRRASAGS